MGGRAVRVSELVHESDLGGAALVAVSPSAFRVNVDCSPVRCFLELIIVGNALRRLAGAVLAGEHSARLGLLRRGDNFRLRDEHFEDYLVREFCDSVEAADELLEPARG